MNNSFDIKTVGVKILCLNSNQIVTLFYGQNSIKSSLKSSAKLHFRDSKLKNFPYKASHLQPSTRASKLQFQPPPPSHAKKGFLRPNSFDIKTVGVKILCLNSNQIVTLFNGQNSIRSSLKSSAILHFRDYKLKNFPYKASHLQRSTRASKLQFQPPSHQKELIPTALLTKTLSIYLHEFQGYGPCLSTCPPMSFDAKNGSFVHVAY